MGRNKINIRGVNIDNFKSVKNICKNQGKTFKDFARPIILKIIEDADPKLKIKCKSKETKDFRLTEVISNEKYQELKNICDNIGVGISTYLKMKMAEELLKYPEYLKNIME